MIELEIIESSDKNVLGKYKFFQNQIYLGRTSGNLQIRDPELLDSHMLIEVVDKDLIIHPQRDVSAYLLEGKRASTVRKIKQHQAIRIGQTEFRVISFEWTQFDSKKAVLDKKLATLIDENSPRLSVVEKLGRMMK